jgi:uncharacterized membrane protein required for colicin V production
MVSLVALFGMLVLLFAIIGAIRGWAKELLVTSAIILALFILQILDKYVDPFRTSLMMQPPMTQFLTRAVLLGMLAFFGYQTPSIRALQPKLARERMQDIVLGFLMGGLNGYLLFGSLWYYLHMANYPTSMVIMPPEGSELALQIESMIKYLPPLMIPEPHIYFAVGIVFVFVIVVFV